MDAALTREAKTVEIEENKLRSMPEGPERDRFAEVLHRHYGVLQARAAYSRSLWRVYQRLDDASRLY
jgi:hypothetical protein